MKHFFLSVSNTILLSHEKKIIELRSNDCYSVFWNQDIRMRKVLQRVLEINRTYRRNFLKLNDRFLASQQRDVFLTLKFDVDIFCKLEKFDKVATGLLTLKKISEHIIAFRNCFIPGWRQHLENFDKENKCFQIKCQTYPRCISNELGTICQDIDEFLQTIHSIKDDLFNNFCKIVNSRYPLEVTVKTFSRLLNKLVNSNNSQGDKSADEYIHVYVDLHIYT